jgi:hypothetical protein
VVAKKKREKKPHFRGFFSRIFLATTKISYQKSVAMCYQISCHSLATPGKARKAYCP